MFDMFFPLRPATTPAYGSCAVLYNTRLEHASVMAPMVLLHRPVPPVRRPRVASRLARRFLAAAPPGGLVGTSSGPRSRPTAGTYFL